MSAQVDHDAYEREAMADTDKDWGAIEVGNPGWYWVVWYVRRWIHLRAYDREGDRALWLIAEGFAPDRDTAVAAMQSSRDAVPGKDYREAYQRARHHLGNKWVRDHYRRFHVRKPRPSGSTDARPEGSLGYLYASACMWDSGWKPYPITKITAKRVFVRQRWAGEPQLAFDRATLERDGRAFRFYGTGSEHFYTEAGKAREDAEAAQRLTAHHAGHFPLLALRPGFTHRDVLSAFRRRAHDVHPDHNGGDAELFRQLVEEKDRALGVVNAKATP